MNYDGLIGIFLGVAITAIMAGAWFGGITTRNEGTCERGEPIVIKAKVYRCVEQK